MSFVSQVTWSFSQSSVQLRESDNHRNIKLSFLFTAVLEIISVWGPSMLLWINLIWIVWGLVHMIWQKINKKQTRTKPALRSADHPLVLTSSAAVISLLVSLQQRQETPSRMSANLFISSRKKRWFHHWCQSSELSRNIRREKSKEL